MCQNLWDGRRAGETCHFVQRSTSLMNKRLYYALRRRFEASGVNVICGDLGENWHSGGTDVPFDGILCDFFILREDGESWRVGRRLHQADRHTLQWKSKMTECVTWQQRRLNSVKCVIVVNPRHPTWAHFMAFKPNKQKRQQKNVVTFPTWSKRCPNPCVHDGNETE